MKGQVHQISDPFCVYVWEQWVTSLNQSMHNEIKWFSLVEVIIMEAKVLLRHPVELQQFTEQLTWEVLLQVASQVSLQLTLYNMFGHLIS